MSRLPSVITPSCNFCLLVTSYSYYADISLAGHTPVCSLQWLLFPVTVEGFKELLENVYSRDSSLYSRRVEGPDICWRHSFIPRTHATWPMLFPSLIMTVTFHRIREVQGASHGPESDYSQFIEVFFSSSRIQLRYYLPSNVPLLLLSKSLLIRNYAFIPRCIPKQGIIKIYYVETS
jgi:hypothetical protein